jgi:hypothetical protein
MMRFMRATGKWFLMVMLSVLGMSAPPRPLPASAIIAGTDASGM